MDSKLLMIGLDAGDPELVERWTGDGTLPHLAALRAQGTIGRLDSSAKLLAGSPWPTMYTGRDVSSHGLYHDFQWRPDLMGFAAPSDTWLDLAPFWRNLDGDLDVVAYDVPFSPSCRAFRGVEMSCWASHDKLAPASSHPADVVEKARRRFGRWTVSYEGYGPGRIDELLALRREMLENTRRSGELAAWLLARYPWRLGIVCLSAPHRGGHRLWDRSSVRGPIAAEQGNEFDGALKDLYVGCDEIVGRLVAAHPDASVVLFSTHGMMVNTSRVDFLEEMLARVLAGGEHGHRRVSLARRFGEALPHEWLRFLTRNVPRSLRDGLVTRWSAGALDWRTTPAFCVRADLQGYIRVNLKGREARGIVEPGAEYDALCARVGDGLASFRDADTGEPFVEAVTRGDQAFPAGPFSDLVPDLIVQWKPTPSRLHRAVRSSRFGTVRRSTPGRVPNGRSGNHRGEGILIARGSGIPKGRTLASRPHIRDLAPTVLERLQVGCRTPLSGAPIAELVASP